VKPKSPAAAERALFALLGSGKVSLRRGRLKDACGIYDPNTGVIRVDAFHGGVLGTVIHELFHSHLYRELDSWGKLEEPVLIALENAVVLHINRRPKLLAKWRQQVEDMLE
jgi:hypothetical protein